MAWIELDSDKLKERFAGAEFNSVTAAALNSGQDADELVESVLERVIKNVRGYAPKTCQLGAGLSIPDELEDAALALAVVKVLTRLPGLKALLTKERTAAAKDARDDLRDWSKGTLTVVPPEDAAPSNEQPAASKISTIQKGAGRYTKENLGGLF